MIVQQVNAQVVMVLGTSQPLAASSAAPTALGHHPCHASQPAIAPSSLSTPFPHHTATPLHPPCMSQHRAAPHAVRVQHSQGHTPSAIPTNLHVPPLYDCTKPSIALLCDPPSPLPLPGVPQTPSNPRGVLNCESRTLHESALGSSSRCDGPAQSRSHSITPTASLCVNRPSSV
jgi:hypothetical protein